MNSSGLTLGTELVPFSHRWIDTENSIKHNKQTPPVQRFDDILVLPWFQSRKFGFCGLKKKKKIAFGRMMPVNKEVC